MTVLDDGSYVDSARGQAKMAEYHLEVLEGRDGTAGEESVIALMAVTRALLALYELQIEKRDGA